MEILKKDILKEMEEKSQENLDKGIDIAVSILKNEFPFVTGWKYKHDPDFFNSTVYIILICDMDKSSEFYNSPIKDYYKNLEADVTYPFSPLEISNEMGIEEKYELYKEIQKSLDETYYEIPNDYRHTFKSYILNTDEPKEINIDGFVFPAPEKLSESESGNDKVSLAKSLIQQLFYEVSFIEQSTYNDRPLLTVYFDSDDTAANIESVFTHEICDTVKDYTSGEIKCNPSWGPKMRTLRNNPDILIDAILLEYDDEGNVLNESEERPNKEIINNVVNELILPNYKDVICDIEYIDKDERLDLMGKISFNQSRVTITFIGERPERFRERDKYDEIMNEIWNTIHDYVGISVDLYARYTDKCEKENINENWFKVPSSDYNSLEKVINLVMKEKYWWWKDIKINTLNYIDLYGDVQIEAELTVDEEWGANQWREFYQISQFPGNKGWEDDEYGYSRRVSLEDITDSTYAEVIRDDLRDIFKYTLNIEAYNMSFINVYLIFE